jgi:hypothetical protein
MGGDGHEYYFVGFGKVCIFAASIGNGNSCNRVIVKDKGSKTPFKFWIL